MQTISRHPPPPPSRCTMAHPHAAGMRVTSSPGRKPCSARLGHARASPAGRRRRSHLIHSVAAPAYMGATCATPPRGPARIHTRTPRHRRAPEIAHPTHSAGVSTIARQAVAPRAALRRRAPGAGRRSAGMPRRCTPPPAVPASPPRCHRPQARPGRGWGDREPRPSGPVRCRHRPPGARSATWSLGLRCAPATAARPLVRLIVVRTREQGILSFRALHHNELAGPAEPAMAGAAPSAARSRAGIAHNGDERRHLVDLLFAGEAESALPGGRDRRPTAWRSDRPYSRNSRIVMGRPWRTRTWRA